MRPLPVLVLVLLVPSAAGLPWDALGSPPVADFTWSPQGARANENVTFVSTSADRDTMVVLHRWHMPGDDELTLRTGSSIGESFPRRGAYAVTLEVWDATLLVSTVTRVVDVANTPPVPSMQLSPSPAFRGVPVEMGATATDVDGDAVVDWTWDLGEGSVAHGANVSHVFHELGTYAITLQATDEGGATAFVSQMLRVLNRPPLVTADFTPHAPRAGEQVVFTASGIDPDVPGGAVTFTWHFSDGVVLMGPQVTRVWEAPGDHTVTLRGEDSEGGVSAPYVLAVAVQPQS